eukprot:CAMPEP_0115009072 /NCGR_PEP_ID=MMETSP0216-20121206/22359_1 /TAXON_ID=223996 /ORGANISM="Protocruzia adherens, Strain Boccale" /LENGTH=227 /DNA_ID=CAMNT_0002376739 /DNA_START=36 /DNA_END=719 /DNA_ORIENTATION=+
MEESKNNKEAPDKLVILIGEQHDTTDGIELVIKFIDELRKQKKQWIFLVERDEEQLDKPSLERCQAFLSVNKKGNKVGYYANTGMLQRLKNTYQDKVIAIDIKEQVVKDSKTYSSWLDGWDRSQTEYWEAILKAIAADLKVQWELANKREGDMVEQIEATKKKVDVDVVIVLCGDGHVPGIYKKLSNGNLLGSDDKIYYLNKSVDVGACLTTSQEILCFCWYKPEFE